MRKEDLRSSFIAFFQSHNASYTLKSAIAHIGAEDYYPLAVDVAFELDNDGILHLFYRDGEAYIQNRLPLPEETKQAMLIVEKAITSCQDGHLAQTIRDLKQAGLKHDKEFLASILEILVKKGRLLPAAIKIGGISAGDPNAYQVCLVSNPSKD